MSDRHFIRGIPPDVYDRPSRGGGARRDFKAAPITPAPVAAALARADPRLQADHERIEGILAVCHAAEAEGAAPRLLHVNDDGTQEEELLSVRAILDGWTPEEARAAIEHGQLPARLYQE